MSKRNPLSCSNLGGTTHAIHQFFRCECGVCSKACHAMDCITITARMRRHRQLAFSQLGVIQTSLLFRAPSFSGSHRRVRVNVNIMTETRVRGCDDARPTAGRTFPVVVCTCVALQRSAGPNTNSVFASADSARRVIRGGQDFHRRCTGTKKCPGGSGTANFWL